MVPELRRAGKISEKVLKKALSLVEKGVSLLELAERAEKRILELGAKPAFPTNTCVGSVAAHYSPPLDDKRTWEEGTLKLDVGAHVDGWIADTALSFGEDEELLNASRTALVRAVERIRPGVRMRNIGEVIWRTAKEHGVKPIRNLGGHQIDRYRLHAGLFVPNVPEGEDIVEEGMILAVEPFMTRGKGYVKEGREAYIFMLKHRRARSPLARKALDIIERRYGSLPFAQRWLEKEFGSSARLALFELMRVGAIRAYPVLVEAGSGDVAQFETTVYVDKDGAQPLVAVWDIYP